MIKYRPTCKYNNIGMVDKAPNDFTRYETTVPAGHNLFSKEYAETATLTDDWDNFAEKILCESGDLCIEYPLN